MIAHDLDFDWDFLIGGVTFLPYQLAFGFSIRYWPSHFSPAIRLYLGPFKFWCYVVRKRYRKEKENEVETTKGIQD